MTGSTFCEPAAYRRELDSDRVARRARARAHAGYGTSNSDPPPPYTSRPASREGRPAYVPTGPSCANERTPLFATSSPDAYTPRPRSPESRAYATTCPSWANESTPLFAARPPRRRRHNTVFSAFRRQAIASIFTFFVTLGLIFGIAQIHFTWPGPYERNIAIIGAGPAGVTTAYHLSRLCSSGAIPARITLYEQDPHIGGRAVHTVQVTPSESVVIGASTFPKTSTLLTSAADSLGLRTSISFSGGIDLIGSGTGTFGVYDGRSWAYDEPKLHNIFNRWGWELGLNMRYGGALQTAQSLISKIRKQRQYPSTFTSLSTALRSAGLAEHAATTAEEFLATHGVSMLVQRELFNPWMRQYAQNLGTVSALAAFAAADNSATLKIDHRDGMAGLWERMVSASGATTNLETRVQNLTGEESWGGWALTSLSPFGTATTTRYDAVVVAAPWGITPLPISPLVWEPQNVSYTPEYTTLFASEAKLSPHAFSGRTMGLILTTPCSWEYTETAGASGVAGLGHAPFWRLQMLQQVVLDGKRMWLYHVTSPAELPDQELKRFVGGKEVAWVYRHYERNAHPLLQPRTEFSNVALAPALWYAGGMEEAAAGAEMATVMGKNVAELIFAQWKREGGKYLPVERRIPKEVMVVLGGEGESE